jgi:hypothetical protein
VSRGAKPPLPVARSSGLRCLATCYSCAPGALVIDPTGLGRHRRRYRQGPSSTTMEDYQGVVGRAGACKRPAGRSGRLRPRGRAGSNQHRRELIGIGSQVTLLPLDPIDFEVRPGPLFRLTVRPHPPGPVLPVG